MEQRINLTPDGDSAEQNAQGAPPPNAYSLLGVALLEPDVTLMQRRVAERYRELHRRGNSSNDVAAKFVMAEQAALTEADRLLSNADDLSQHHAAVFDELVREYLLNRQQQ